MDYRGMRFEVGQNVILKRLNGMKKGTHYGIKIVKIGRKYLTLGLGDNIRIHHQIDMETGLEKSDTSPDFQMFLSEEHLEKTMKREENLRIICDNQYTIKKNEHFNDILQEIVNMIEEA